MADGDFRLAFGWRRHWKRRLLQRRLGAEGVLALEDLWAHAAENRPSGDLSGMSVDAIEAACDWSGECGALVRALSDPDLRLLDDDSGNYSLHDWSTHQPWIVTAPQRHKKSSESAAAKWGNGTNPNKTRSQRLAEARLKGTHTADQWNALVNFCGKTCVRCGATGGEIVKDHIQPIYQGGSDGIDNLQPLCRSCNSSKGPEVEDFRPDGWKNACQSQASSTHQAGTKRPKMPAERLAPTLPIPSNPVLSVPSLPKPSEVRAKPPAQEPPYPLERGNGQTPGSGTIETPPIPQYAPPFVPTSTPVPTPPPQPEESKPGKKPRTPRRTIRQTVVANPTPEVAAVFETWKRVAEHPGAVLTQDRADLIAGWIPAYSCASLCKAIEGAGLTPWNNGQETGKAYLDLGLILRDPDHIDRFTRNADNPPTTKNRVDILDEAEREWVGFLRGVCSWNGKCVGAELKEAFLECLPERTAWAVGGVDGGSLKDAADKVRNAEGFELERLHRSFKSVYIAGPPEEA